MKQITFILLVLTKGLLSQTDTLNKFDSNGKKNGYWLVYLDQNANPTDSLNSFYYGYDLYVNGYKFIYFMNDKSKADNRLVHHGNNPEKGHPMLINGQFSWFDKETNTRHSIESYRNGHPQFIEFYAKIQKTDTTTYLRENINYAKKYENDFYSYYYRICSVKGNNIEERYFRKVGRKWRAYSIK